MDYNIWNKWDKLQTVMLGECYTPEFFRDIKNIKVKSALQRIANETQEDLEGYEKVLKDFGCDVIRPDMDKDDSIMNYIDHDGKLLSIPRSPLQPRDAQMVIGNSLFYTGDDHPGIRTRLDLYNTSFIQMPLLPLREQQYLYYKGNDAPDWPSYDDFVNKFLNAQPLSPNIDIHKELIEMLAKEKNYIRFSERFPVAAPSITVVGKDIYLDYQSDWSIIIDDCIAYLRNKFPNFRFNLLNIGGHSDGCFHTIKPGAILSLREIQTYEDTFPDWDICYLPDQSWSKVDKFQEIKDKTGGKWWVPGEEDNNEFTYFVETWLQDWVGYVEETVFDVNVLVLDEHHVCVSQPDNEIVNTFLKKHNMEPVYVPWRHRYFWDGGLHCITLDLRRDGTQQDYFPNRHNSITDKGF
tara:strand:+ start:49 stop:1272 length:1224 start_codon:yes stop_codon:yes gene_type:complete